MEETNLRPTLHPLKIFDLAKSKNRFVYACAPMVRYSKLAFRQTVHEYGVDLAWTPMILAKEFNRSHLARDSDFTVSTRGSQPATIVQFGSNSPLEFSRAASLAAPFVNGVDLNCGCPQSWACSDGLGASLMWKRELVRDMFIEARGSLRRDGWERDKESLEGRSLSVKIRIHKDLRKTFDFLNTVIGDPQEPLVDWVTVHPRTRQTPSSTAINTEALSIIASEFGHKIPLLLSGDVFTLKSLPTPIVPPAGSQDCPSSNGPVSQSNPSAPSPTPSNTNIAGLMSARGLLTNPALFAGHDTCPWEAVEAFMRNVARAPLPIRLVLHHLSEMCGPGMGADKTPLLERHERLRLLALGNMVEIIDFMDEMIELKTGRAHGMERV